MALWRIATLPPKQHATDLLILNQFNTSRTPQFFYVEIYCVITTALWSHTKVDDLIDFSHFFILSGLVSISGSSVAG